MKLENIRCRGCNNKIKKILLRGIYPEDGDPTEVKDVLIDCLYETIDENNTVSETECLGPTLINIDTSPVEWLQNIIKCFPQPGIPISVIKDENEPVILGFSHNGKDYEGKTTFSCSIVNTDNKNQRITYYEIELHDGRALIIQVANIGDINASPESWLLGEIEESDRPRPESLPGKNCNKNKDYNIWAYKIVYEIENLLQEIVDKKFTDTDSLLKSIKGEKETLYQSLQRKKNTEESKQLKKLNLPLIAYMDWSEWINLFDSKWEQIFQFPNNFEAKKSFKQLLEQVQPSRNKVAHMREVGLEDIKLLQQSYTKVKSLR